MLLVASNKYIRLYVNRLFHYQHTHTHTHISIIQLFYVYITNSFLMLASQSATPPKK